MFIRITKDGRIRALRGNQWKYLKCVEDGNKFCNDSCAGFGETILSNTTACVSEFPTLDSWLRWFNSEEGVRVCRTYLEAHTADDRIDEPFIIEPPIPDPGEEEDDSGNSGLAILESLISGMPSFDADEDDDDEDDVEKIECKIVPLIRLKALESLVSEFISTNRSLFPDGDSVEDVIQREIESIEDDEA